MFTRELEETGYNRERITISASRVRGATRSGFVSVSLSARSMNLRLSEVRSL